MGLLPVITTINPIHNFITKNSSLITVLDFLVTVYSAAVAIIHRVVSSSWLDVTFFAGRKL